MITHFPVCKETDIPSCKCKSYNNFSGKISIKLSIGILYAILAKIICGLFC